MSESKPSRRKKVVSTDRQTSTDKAKAKRKTKSSADEDTSIEMLFRKKNYLWVGIGLVCLLIGFLLMLGGEQSSPDVWEPEKIYSFRRITLAPFFILLGLGIQIYAIFKK